MSSERNHAETAVTYDADPDESLSDAVVSAVASASGLDPVPATGADGPVLPPLYSAVDPEALDGIFGPGPTDGSVHFTYHRFDVTARGTGEVVVEQPPTAEGAAAEGLEGS